MKALIRDSGLQTAIETSVAIPDEDDDMARLLLIRELRNAYLRFQVGLRVNPPPLAELTI